MPLRERACGTQKEFLPAHFSNGTVLNMTTNKVRVRDGFMLFACGLTGLLAAVGCSSSSPPAWASALGSGVTIVAPATVSPGHDSPGAVIQGVFAAVAAKRYTDECAYIQPSAQAECKDAAASFDPTNAPDFKNTGIGYVAIDGDKALVGTTGTYCVPSMKPECYTNNDPAAIFSSNKTAFGQFWTEQSEASNNSSTNAYSLAPCVKIGGSWYISESS
jgi:hypothetical protein